MSQFRTKIKFPEHERQRARQHRTGQSTGQTRRAPDAPHTQAGMQLSGFPSPPQSNINADTVRLRMDSTPTSRPPAAAAKPHHRQNKRRDIVQEGQNKLNQEQSDLF